MHQFECNCRREKLKEIRLFVSEVLEDIGLSEIDRHKVILAQEIEDCSLQDIENGKIPSLKALNLHNGTIYRWNRPCFGANNGVAHIRIENESRHFIYN